MQNPWQQCPENQPFVLESDWDYVTAHNYVHRDNTEHVIDYSIPPAPSLGLHDAPVVVLLANPGLHETELPTNRLPSVIELALANLSTDGGTPHYPLTEDYPMPVSENWWGVRTKELAEEVGGYAVLAHRLLAVELHGYHTSSWCAPLANFPSQAWGFNLVRRAMDRKAVIIVARCQRHWFASVPGLAEHPRLVPKLLSPRSVYLSRGNLGPEYFDLVASALTAG